MAPSCELRRSPKEFPRVTMIFIGFGFLWPVTSLLSCFAVQPSREPIAFLLLDSLPGTDWHFLSSSNLLDSILLVSSVT